MCPPLDAPMRRGNRLLWRKLKLPRVHMPTVDSGYCLLVPNQTTVWLPAMVISTVIRVIRATSQLPPAYCRPQLAQLGSSTCSGVVSQVAGSKGARQSGPFQWQGFVVLWFVVEKTNPASALVIAQHPFCFWQRIRQPHLCHHAGWSPTHASASRSTIASSDYMHMSLT